MEAGHHGVDGDTVQRHVAQVPGLAAEHVLIQFLSLVERSVWELTWRLRSVLTKCVHQWMEAGAHGPGGHSVTRVVAGESREE